MAVFFVVNKLTQSSTTAASVIRPATISATATDWHWLKTHPAWGWLVRTVPWLKEPNAPGIVAKAEQSTNG